MKLTRLCSHAPVAARARWTGRPLRKRNGSKLTRTFRTPTRWPTRRGESRQWCRRGNKSTPAVSTDSKCRLKTHFRGCGANREMRATSSILSLVETDACPPPPPPPPPPCSPGYARIGSFPDGSSMGAGRSGSPMQNFAEPDGFPSSRGASPENFAAGNPRARAESSESSQSERDWEVGARFLRRHKVGL